jgi:hypothetical protein
MSSILDNPPDQRKSTRSGTMMGYHVEARAALGLDRSFTVGDTTVTSHWRRIQCNYGTPGVPIGKVPFEPVLAMADLVDYSCAQAMRWWFVALAEYFNKSVDTRIVEHSITWSCNSEPTRTLDEVTSEQVMFPHKQTQ